MCCCGIHYLLSCSFSDKFETFKRDKLLGFGVWLIRCGWPTTFRMPGQQIITTTRLDVNVIT